MFNDDPPPKEYRKPTTTTGSTIFAGTEEFHTGERHMFKVGDKGKTRGGEHYEVIHILDRADVDASEQLVVLIRGSVSTRFIDGLLTMRVHDLDLLPPKQKIEGYLFIYDHHEPGFYTARKDGFDYHEQWSNPPRIKAVVPVTVEYEEREGLGL